MNGDEDSLSFDITSPGQLQDVTMDNAYSLSYPRSTSVNSAMGSRGNTSPGQGRSLREYDEQLNVLRKENFHLKLRIYFLEEKNPSVALGSDGSAQVLYKENVDLKVETEALRKELKEKHDLLCEAATAMDLMEQSQKKGQDESLAIIDDLKQKIQFLEMEIKALEKSGVPNPIDFNTLLLNETSTSPQVVTTSTADLDTQTKIAELEEYITKTNELNLKLQQTEQLVGEKDTEIQLYEDKCQQLCEQIAELKEKCLNNTELNNFEQQESEYKTQMAEKECMIQILEEKLQEKNQAHERGCKVIQFLMSRIDSLGDGSKPAVADTDVQNINHEQLSAIKDAEIANLKLSVENAIREAAEANHWRKQCADVCGMLTSRLTELAEFLDSLLKHKDILGVLAQDRRKAMRKAVDKSLDLSKSLNNLSVTINGRLSLNETSLLQITSLSDVLNNSYLENKENQLLNISGGSVASTAAIGNNQSAVVIEMLRAEVKSLKSEIERNVKKERKSLTIMAPATQHNSDSETWSEPDRKVSHARIGLDGTTSMRQTCEDTSTSDDCLKQEMNRRYELICDQQKIVEIMAEHDNQKLKAQCDLVATDNLLKEERLKFLALQDEMASLKTTNESYAIEINALKERLDGEQLLVANLKTALDEHVLAFEKLTSECDLLKYNMAAAKQQLSQLKEHHKVEIDDLMTTQNEILEKVQSNLIESHKKDLEQNWVSQTTYEERARQVESLNKRLGEAEALIEFHRDNEKELNDEILEFEKNCRALRKNIDEATLQASKAVVERAKAVSEKLVVEKSLQELKNQFELIAFEKTKLNTHCAQLEKTAALLQNRLVRNESNAFELQRSASQGTVPYQHRLKIHQQSSSGYTSDDIKDRCENSSPDFGIDIDAKHGSSQNFMITTTASMANIFLEDEEQENIVTNHLNDNNLTKSPLQKSTSTPIMQHDCVKIDKENMELKRKLISTHNAYKNILAQLKISNQRKEKVQRDIQREICKTNNVLKTVRTNIESVEQTTSRPPATTGLLQLGASEIVDRKLH